MFTTTFFKKALILLFLFVCFGGNFQEKALKVACIGDSVTYGLLLDNQTVESYPSQLQLLLGEKYEVNNFGRSGATLLKKGHNPYYKTKEFEQALAFNPDIAIIHLGLNDTDPRNFPNYKLDFNADYSWLLDTLKSRNPHIKLYICRLTPIFSEHPRFKSGTRDWYWQIQDHIKDIAEANSVSLIDLHEKLYSLPNYFVDSLHPNKDGAKLIANIIYENITQNYGGLKVDSVFMDNMVIQRNMPIVVYGTANGGDQIEVVFNRQIRKTNADKYGNWKVSFPEMKYGKGSYEMSINGKDKIVVIKNILIGDVWFCSGQSNMLFPLQSSENGIIESRKTDVNSTIRLLNMNILRDTDNTAWNSEVLDKTNKLDFFSGKWAVCDSINVREFSAIAYYFGKNISQEENVPIGLIQLSVGGSPIESWIDRNTIDHDDKIVDMLTNWRKSDYIMDWVRERANVNIEKATSSKQRHPYEPCYSFEAGVKNFTSFPIKGVIWYQGESNAHNIELYQHLMQIMVESWRKHWGFVFPFYFVQLSSTNRPTWGEFRNVQNVLQREIPNSFMAVSFDLGDINDFQNVHPVKKKEVADRLANLALKNTYNRNIIAEGPYFLSYKRKEDKLEINFGNSKHLTTSDKNHLTGFEIITNKGKRIECPSSIDRNTVILNIAKEEKIKSILYAWKPFSFANLVNEAGFPCSTFRVEIE